MPIKFSVAAEKFQSGSLAKNLGNPRLWMVREPFIWWLDYEQKTERVTVPAGFVTDMGSIPRIFWVFVAPSDFLACILHDYLYETGKYSRAEADAIFREALLVEGASVWLAWAMWAAVRIFGGPRFKKTIS